MERFPHGCYDVTHEHRLCKYSTGGRGEARVYFLAHRRVYSLPAATHVLPAVPAFSPRPRSNVVVYDYVICLRRGGAVLFMICAICQRRPSPAVVVR